MGIYGAGKAFNLRYAQNTYVPNRGMNIRQARQPIMFGGHCHCAPQNTNVTINNGPTGFWGFMSGLFGGLFGGGGMMGMGMGGGLFGGLFSNLFGGGMGSFNPFGMINAQQAQPQQLSGNQDKLANLKTLYPNHNIVSDGNDKYSATDKEGHLIGKGLSYEDMCEALSKAKSEEKEKVENDDNKNGGKVKDDDTGKVKDDDTGKVKDDNTGKVKDDDTGKVKDNSGTRRSGRSSKAGGSNKADGTQGTGKKEWTDAEKAKPRRLNMTVDVNSSFGKCTATVVTPDGKTYKVQAATGGTSTDRINRLSTAMQNALKAAGWTQVTLENKNFKWASDGKEATGKVDKPNGGKQWSAQDKANYKKPMTIAFAVHSGGGIGNSGSATVTTPDGQLHQVSTGVSLTAARARKDLANKMIELLHSRGWTNAQLQNNNFNDWQ